MNHSSSRHLPVIPHAGYLSEQAGRPAYLGESGGVNSWPYDSSGLQGDIRLHQQAFKSEIWQFKPGLYQLRCYYLGQLVERQARLDASGRLETSGAGLMSGPGAVFLAEIEHGDQSWTLLLREVETRSVDKGYLQVFQLFRTVMQRTDRLLEHSLPANSRVRLRIGLGENRSLFPLQLAPSVLDVTGRRIPLSSGEAVERLADLLLAHRPPFGRTLVYADDSVDLFGLFALQEVGRLLGIRNLHASAIWGPEAVAASALRQRGHLTPGLSAEQVFAGGDRLFLLNGWNGFVTHLPLFERLLNQPDCDAWLISVMTTETAKVLADKLGAERILLILPGGESLLALAIAHELIHRYPQAIARDFVAAQGDFASFEEFIALAASEMFAPDKVASLLVPEAAYADRLLQGIHVLAERLAQPETVPIHLPGIDLMQSGGMAAYSLWTNLLALTGKLGHSEGRLRGGELRLLAPGNEEAQLQHLGPNRFFGQLPVDAAGCREAARRMGLPEDTYDALPHEAERPIQAFSTAGPGSQRELILCIGTGLETRWLRDHELWRQRLERREVTLVVIDPMPGPFLLEHAALCLPTPPPQARHRLSLNGEGRLTPTYPRRQPPAETRSETSLLYDAMAEVSRLLRADEDLRLAHPDLAMLSDSGWLQQRFEPPDSGGGLMRVEGEVLRPQLWERLQSYSGGETPLPGHFLDADGAPLSWTSLLASPARAATSTPAFQFFVPTEADFALPAGVLLNIGSAMPNASPADVRFAIDASASANTRLHEALPAERWLFVAATLAAELDLHDGDWVRLSHDAAEAIAFEIRVSDWLKGRMVYLHQYMTAAELSGQVVIPWLRYSVGSCAYSGVPLLKKVQVRLTPEKGVSPDE